MYTEDDEEVKLKNRNSQNDNSDFYTPFDDTEVEEEIDDKKTKKKPLKEEIVSQDDDYSDFYGNNDKEFEEPPKNKGVIYKIILIVFLLIVLIVLLIILLGNSKDTGDIELSNNSYSLKTGEKEYISYKIVGTESMVTSTFTSSNPSVATVDANGQITAVGTGTATITIKYTIDGKTKEKKCDVKVEGPVVNHTITLNLTASTTNWTNKDVTIKVDAKSDGKVTSIKYATNCSSNCSYVDVSNNQIVISANGTTKVKVVAKDSNNKEATKEVTVNIDKEAPSITYNGKTSYSSDSEVTVCATCSDKISGCKEEKVCQKYTSSKTNQVITVYDKAGNSKKSTSFDVKINKLTQPCKLSVTSNGTVKATLNGTFTYYGFSSSYSGTNTLSKKISISASKNGESKAKLVYYYVKDKNNNKGSCHLTIIKECKCKENKTNCTPTCTFRSS